MRNELGDRLKEMRLEAGMSQESLANKLGYTRQAISLYENGKRTVPDSALKGFSSVFEVSLDSLLELKKRDAVYCDFKGDNMLYSSSGDSHEPLPVMLWPMHAFVHLFPYRITWEHLIEKKLMSAGYSIPKEVSVKAFQEQCCIEHQLFCLDREGVSEEALSELIMYFPHDKDVPDGLSEAPPRVVMEYVNIILEAIKKRDGEERLCRRAENESGDYRDYRHDRTVHVEDLHYFLSSFLKLGISDWFPVDYRLTALSDKWSNAERKKNLEALTAYIIKENVLRNLAHLRCYGIWEYGSAYYSIFDSLFDTKDVESDGFVQIRMARIKDTAKEFLAWYEDLERRMIDS